MNLHIDPFLQTHAQRVATELLAEIAGARAVVIATEDGFSIAHALAEPLDTGRIAAMTSSIAAIGQAIAQETALGTPNCLVVDASGGFLIMRRVQCQGVALVVNALTHRDVLLGMAMHNVANAARHLEQPA